MRKVSVIAGTPVDTQMGVDFLKMKNAGAAEDRLVEPLYRPVAEDCDVQVRFQYSSFSLDLVNSALEKSFTNFIMG